MKVLVIACGDKKNETPAGPVPAIDLYKGRQFALARRLAAKGWEVLIISARHGLVRADHRLASYDCPMTAQRSAACVAAVKGLKGMSPWLFRAATEGTRQVVFYGGERYFRVFEALMAVGGPATYDEEGARACEVETIVGAGCGDHYSVLATLVAQEEAA